MKQEQGPSKATSHGAVMGGQESEDDARDHTVRNDEIQGGRGQSICKDIVSEKFSVSLNR